MKSTLRKAIFGIVSAVVVVALASPARANAAPTHQSIENIVASTTATQMQGAIKVNPAKAAAPQVCAESPTGEVTCVRVKKNGALSPGLPAEVLVPKGDIGTQWTVGIGWYVYLYLNHNDVVFMGGLTFAGFSGVLCTMLASTFVGGFACSVAAYVVWEFVVKAKVENWVPPGYCLELKFRTGFHGGKVVGPRNC